MDPAIMAALDLIKGPFGYFGLALMVLLLGGRRVWVWGWVYDAKDRSEQDWKAIAQAGITTSQATITQAERALDLAEKMQNRRRAGDGEEAH